MNSNDFSTILSPFIDFLIEAIDEPPLSLRAPHNRPNACQLELIQTAKVLADVNQESKTAILTRLRTPIAPLIPGMWGSSVSMEGHASNMGTAYRKLYNVLDFRTRIIAQETMKYVDRRELVNLFSTTDIEFNEPTIPINPTPQTFEFGDLQGEAQYTSIRYQHRPALYGHFHLQAVAADNDPPNIAADLFGSLEQNPSQTFKGLARLTLSDGSLCYLSTGDETVALNEHNGSTDLTHLFHNRKGVKVNILPSRDRFEWHGVYFNTDGTLIDNCLGDWICISIDGEVLKWEGVKFNRDGSFVENCIGSKIVYYPGDSQKIWQGVRFDHEGQLIQDCVGDKIQVNANGEKRIWQGVAFNSDGTLVDGCEGSWVVEYPDGTSVAWHGVRFNRDGTIKGNNTVQRNFSPQIQSGAN